MKTLFLTGFCNSALKAMGKLENSLDDEVTGDDLRVIAAMLDVADSQRKANQIKDFKAEQSSNQ